VPAFPIAGLTLMLPRWPAMRSAQGEMTTLHEARIDAVKRHLIINDVNSVLDLGCGVGELLVRLREESQFTQLVGVDLSMNVLAVARHALGLNADMQDKRVCLLHASFTERDPRLSGFDAVTLVETIEHVAPEQLSAVEHAVFSCYRPRIVIVTTPNQDYNTLHGMRPGTFRHPDHRFEWGRARFKQWALGVAARNTYSAIFIDIGEIDQELGGSTQMAVFRRIMAA
jgi:3' terminal RNA ribose 2'-O-methyltransferase Hen1